MTRTEYLWRPSKNYLSFSLFSCYTLSMKSRDETLRMISYPFGPSLNYIWVLNVVEKAIKLWYSKFYCPLSYDDRFKILNTHKIIFKLGRQILSNWDMSSFITNDSHYHLGFSEVSVKIKKIVFKFPTVLIFVRWGVFKNKTRIDLEPFHIKTRFLRSWLRK